jgi:hypothetical protein
MSDQPPASVAALIAQWRAEAKEQRALAIDWPGYRRSYYADGKAQALEVCARDVEALIGRLPVPMPDIPRVRLTRFEVIDETGRVYSRGDVGKIDLSFQDDGRTLKVFVNHVEPQEPKP